MPFTREQLEERRGFVGASESSAALGLSPFFTQMQLYMSKLGQGEPIEETVPMMVGIALEPVTLKLFERETQMMVSDHQRQYVDPQCAWRRCSVDGMAPDGWIVEAKTSGDFRGWGDGEDAIPAHYLYNAHHSLACVPDAPGVYFPVLIGGRSFRYYIVPREDELVDLVRRGEEDFMDMVRKRRPPEPKTREDVMLLYPKDLGTIVTADELTEAKVQAHAKAKLEAKAIEEKIDLLARDITNFMGTAGTLKRLTLTGSQGAPLATWNSQDTRRVDADALRANYPDIAKEVTKSSSGRRLLNKLKVA
jgi:putative phage-type endonuclease